MVAVVFPRDIGFEERIANARSGRRRNGEYGVIGVGIRECIAAVSEVSGIVVVQQVIVAGLAVRVDRTDQRLKVVDNGSHTRLGGVRAVSVRPAARRSGTKGTVAVTILGIPVVRARGRIRVFNLV